MCIECGCGERAPTTESGRYPEPRRITIIMRIVIMTWSATMCMAAKTSIVVIAVVLETATFADMIMVLGRLMAGSGEQIAVLKQQI